MITKKEETEYEKPKLFRFWNFLIYGCFFAIGALWAIAKLFQVVDGS